MEFEEILLEIGDFGRYQKYLIQFFMVPTTFVTSLYVMNVLFMVSVPEHWCYVPELESTNLTLLQKKQLSLPVDDQDSFSKCQMYAVDYRRLVRNITWPNGSALLPTPHPDWPVQACQDGWVYTTDLYWETAATKWNLVCEHDGLPSLVLCMANIGSAIGTLAFGIAADKLGRKIAFFTNIIVATVCGTLSVFAPNFTTFAILRMLVGGTLPSNFQLPYIIIVEQVGPKVRSSLICLSWLLWTSGSCFLALVAFLSKSWVTLGLVTSLPVALFLTYWKYLPQSARFLIVHGRYEEAAATISHIATKNRKDIPDDLFAKLMKIGQTMYNEKQEEDSHSLLDFFKFPQLRKKLFIITLSWSAIAVAYFGLTINISNLGGNDFLNYFCLSVIELPAFVLGRYLMDRWGRKWTNSLFVTTAGLFCLMPVFIPSRLKIFIMVASVMGKFGSAVAFMVIYQQAAELYPTPVRSMGMSIGSMVSSLAIICMPYVVYLGTFNKFIPFLIIGVMCVTAGVLALLVPETLHENLPQTLEESEKFGVGETFFSCARSKKESRNCETTDEKTRRERISG